MPGKIATVIGSTGLIGSHLINCLQHDDTFRTIRALVRRPVDFQQSKVEMKLVNFDDYESVKIAIDGSDAVFCAIGTTQKKVNGDKEAYRKVDYAIPVTAARICSEVHCPRFLFVSSVGANTHSKNFYLSLKGEVEDVIRQFVIPQVSVFRPSILLGKRAEFRLGEKVGQSVMSFFAFLLVGKSEKYRPVHAELVAKAMIQAAKEENLGYRIYEFDEIRHLAAALNTARMANY
jgi:uncharacterized protein YbjT (DUF2867 family)